jgi:hypothetical protein
MSNPGLLSDNNATEVATIHKIALLLITISCIALSIVDQWYLVRTTINVRGNSMEN